ncbi:hypothetical protein BRAS3843_1390017 [Bradyrhizobium sp. STM 3843]|nr:hypothetical protein BRAS3843_1390017 [Bradyrhizobium sp. STM 3843]
MLGQSAIRREPRSSVVMQFVQAFQVSDCRYLQEIEVVFAGITKIGDVSVDGGTPAIVLADTAVEQQVVAPSERTCAFYGLRSHGHLPDIVGFSPVGSPQRQRKTDEPFRSANCSGAMLFRRCAASCLRMNDIGAAISDVMRVTGLAVDVSRWAKNCLERRTYEGACVPRNKRLQNVHDFRFRPIPFSTESAHYRPPGPCSGCPRSGMTGGERPED